MFSLEDEDGLEPYIVRREDEEDWKNKKTRIPFLVDHQQRSHDFSFSSKKIRKRRRKDLKWLTFLNSSSSVHPGEILCACCITSTSLVFALLTSFIASYIIFPSVEIESLRARAGVPPAFLVDITQGRT